MLVFFKPVKGLYATSIGLGVFSPLGFLMNNPTSSKLAVTLAVYLSRMRLNLTEVGVTLWIFEKGCLTNASVDPFIEPFWIGLKSSIRASLPVVKYCDSIKGVFNWKDEVP